MHEPTMVDTNKKDDKAKDEDDSTFDEERNTIVNEWNARIYNDKGE